MRNVKGKGRNMGLWPRRTTHEVELRRRVESRRAPSSSSGSDRSRAANQATGTAVPLLSYCKFPAFVPAFATLSNSLYARNLCLLFTA